VDRVRLRLAKALLVVISVCFTVQVFSPLRLNTDATVLLSMGASAAQGRGFLDDGEKTFFPPGYPALLAVLLTLGLGHPWIIIGLNMVFLLVGLFCVYSVFVHEFFEDRVIVLMQCAFFLLSFVVIKHSTIPLTDVPFFCCCMGCVAIMSHAAGVESNLRFALLVGVACLAAAVAITVRTIGVALFLPLVCLVVRSPQFRRLAGGLTHGGKVLTGVTAVLLGGGSLYALAHTSYWRVLIEVVHKARVSELILQILFFRFRELGELFANLPSSKIPVQLSPIVPWMGLFLLTLTFFGLATKLRKAGPTEVFLLSYVGILFIWPYHDARFWLPVVPLVIAYTELAVQSLRVPRVIVLMYCIAFAIIGFGAIAYTTRITFAGPDFPYRYGDGYLRPTYCAILQSCGNRADPDKVDLKVLRLLREYR
jgi:hypothetical protein